MRIIELNIIQFGKFKDRSFTLERGFNVVKGDNESGKSTLLGFIKFALYGVGRKNPSIAVGERERALSWNVGIAAGSLVIEDVDGKRYRIERSGREGERGTYVDKARIIDLTSGEEVFSGEVPGEHFLGIDAGAYDSMCNIKQLDTVAIGADAVKGVIDNLLSSGDENTNVQGAIKMLDTERRRLLHTNGRGGLVYEGELALNRLKADYKSAISFEGECIKNKDELEAVEQSLAKAQEEFKIAQKMCDIHDDVLRLQKFDTLAELKEKRKAQLLEISNLERGAHFDIDLASYERIARLNGASESLGRSESSLAVAKNELLDSEAALSSVKIENFESFGEIIDQYGSVRNAISHLETKKKKRSSSALALTVLGIACAVLLVFAATLALAMDNFAGGTTVAFIGILFGIGAISAYKKFRFAKAGIDEFMSKLGEGFCPKNEDAIRTALEGFLNDRSDRARFVNANESAKFRVAVAEDSYRAELDSARVIAKEVGLSCEDGELCDALSRLANDMREYLDNRKAVEGEAHSTKTLIDALTSELERFNEADIRARITPEILEKMRGASFEKLKHAREMALQRTSQINQYKAGIERNLMASEMRRSSAEIYPEIEAQEKKLEELKLRLDAVRLAMETVNAASLELKSDFTPRIRDNARKNLSTVTDGKYTELHIDENMGLTLFTEGATRPIDYLSKGSLDATYLSVRLALLETLLDGREPPLYMDESLSQLDDTRAKNALRAIIASSNGSQCVLFTCQERDVKLVRSITDVNLIEL